MAVSLFVKLCWRNWALLTNSVEWFSNRFDFFLISLRRRTDKDEGSSTESEDDDHNVDQETASDRYRDRFRVEFILRSGVKMFEKRQITKTILSQTAFRYRDTWGGEEHGAQGGGEMNAS